MKFVTENILNNNGQRTDPWGTLLFVVVKLLCVPISSTLYVMLNIIGYRYTCFLGNTRHVLAGYGQPLGIESKALDKSITTVLRYLLSFLIESHVSSHTLWVRWISRGLVCLQNNLLFVPTLNHYGIMAPYSAWILVNTGSCNALLSDGTKPLSEAMEYLFMAKFTVRAHLPAVNELAIHIIL